MVSSFSTLHCGHDSSMASVRALAAALWPSPISAEMMSTLSGTLSSGAVIHALLSYCRHLSTCPRPRL